MSVISAILEPQADGSVHLVLPQEFRHRRVRVQATIEFADDAEGSVPVATPEMLRLRKQALADLRAAGGLRDVIPDPMAWQREMRQGRDLPGRD